MLRDPFADKSLIAYLEASERHSAAVEEMIEAARNGGHSSFAISAAQARALAVQVEEAYSLMLKARSDGGGPS